MANATSGWGAGAIGAFGAMIGSVVGAGMVGVAMQSRQFRGASPAKAERALVLTTGVTGVLGALVGVKMALDHGIGCAPCSAGQVRQALVATPGVTPGFGTTPAGSSSWEGGALAASGAAVGGVLGAALSAAVMEGRSFRGTPRGKRQRTLVLTTASASVLGALFGGKAVADAGIGCAPCVNGPVPPPQVTTPVLNPPTEAQLQPALT